MRSSVASWLGRILALLAVIPAVAFAQEPPATLTLEEAIALARRNNPEYLQQSNDGAAADWAVREAYGNLLPGASVSTGFQYQAEGQPRFGLFTGGDLGLGSTPSYYYSNYSLGLTYQFSPSTILRVSQARANRRATDASIQAADFSLVAEVTRQYLAVRSAADGVELARQELARARENLKLAEARVAVGAAIPLDAKQAAVEHGRAEVALIQAENTLRTEKLRLVERIGIELDRDIQLTSDFAIFEPTWDREQLIAMAMARHPQLLALRAAREVAQAGVRMARGAYLPTVEFGAFWTGSTREAGNVDALIANARQNANDQYQSCQLLNQVFQRLTDPLPTADCGPLAWNDGMANAIRDQNSAFPFSFTSDPLTAQLRISIPIFTGFTRQRQVESARVEAEDARHRLRAHELRIRTEVSTALQDLQTAWQTVRLEERTRELADEQLNLARERYRVGASSFVELMEAETQKARADRSYLNAVYAFHGGLAALEAAVGQVLRPEEGSQQ